MDLYQWLVRSVGWGKQPKPRKNLFLKLCRLVEIKGEEVKRIILEVFHESRTHHDDKPPDHYFCKSIKLRLMDRELWYEARPYDHLSGADLDAQFKDYGPLPLFEAPAMNGEPVKADSGGGGAAAGKVNKERWSKSAHEMAEKIADRLQA